MALRRDIYIFTNVGILKLATIVFGVIVLIIGLRSHFESAWLKYDFHKLCHLDHYNWAAPCPDIAMERFYVAMVIICLLLSVIGLLLFTFMCDPYNALFWIFDISFHGLASVLLFIAAILHIVSAIKISQHPLVIGDDHPFLPPHVIKIRDKEMFLSTQKIIAGVLTVIESFVYIASMNAIKRARSRVLLLRSENP